jgi:DNA mismatch repair ATPase MutL
VLLYLTCEIASKSNILESLSQDASSLNPNEGNEEAETPRSKDRPLAARRKKITSEGGAEDTPSKAVDNSEVAESETPPTSETKKVTEPGSDPNTPRDEKKIAITSERTREIEKEIAERTASFDKELLQKGKDEEAETKKKMSEKLIQKKAALLARNPLQAYEVIRLFRLVFIVAVAIVTGKSLLRVIS